MIQIEEERIGWLDKEIGRMARTIKAHRDLDVYQMAFEAAFKV